MVHQEGSLTCVRADPGREGSISLLGGKASPDALERASDSDDGRGPQSLSDVLGSPFWGKLLTSMALMTLSTDSSLHLPSRTQDLHSGQDRSGRGSWFAMSRRMLLGD